MVEADQTDEEEHSLSCHQEDKSSDVAATETERVSSELQNVDAAGSSAVRQRGTSTITLDSTESMSLEDHGKAVDRPAPHPDHDYHEAGELQRGYPALAEYVERLEQENATLTAQLSVVRSQSMSLEVVKTDDEWFKCLTGIPNYGVFAALVRYFEKKVRRLKWWLGFVIMKELCTPSGAAKRATREYSRRLSVEQEFFAVLVRL